jgi:thiosulfate/3-mercaptopyruvate sulfurtransferase
MGRDSALVSADWAEENLDTPGVVFVEIDEDTTTYDGGHLPGAVQIGWECDLHDPVRGDFIDPERFSMLLSERGIGNDDTVILYGGDKNWLAGYAYGYFRLYGHGDVRLLDGGRTKWERDGRAFTTEVPQRQRTRYTASASNLLIRAFRDEVVREIEARNRRDA